MERKEHFYDAAEVPLCVDLDETLTRSNMLFEGAAKVLRTRPAAAVALACWAIRGRAQLKARIAEGAEVDVRLLPYNPDVISLITSERERHREIVLVTGADRRHANAVADHLGIFDTVLASDGNVNLTGKRKLALLTARYGAGNFDYVGNARSDLIVWRGSRLALVAGASPAVRRAAVRWGNADVSMPPCVPRWPALLRAMRPHQWIKNALIFLPLLFAHRLYDLAALRNDAIAFVAFSLTASAIYLFNDIIDLEHDRRHTAKRERPFASGDLPLAAGFAMAPALLFAATLLACAVSPQFALVVLGYATLSLAYSLSLKSVALLDVIVLAGLYVSRIIAGSVASGVVASFWLLAFALFMFSSLAMLKRYSELLALRRDRPLSVAGRDYSTGDSEIVAMFGIGNGYVAVLIVALYINGDMVRGLYAHPAILWGVCPILLYWISRIWLVAHRGRMHEDPIVFAIRDRASIVVAALILIVGCLATIPIRF